MALDPGPGPGPGTNPAGTTGRGGHAHIPTGDDHAHVPALAPEADLGHLFTHGDTGPDIRLSFTLHGIFPCIKHLFVSYQNVPQLTVAKLTL